MKKAIEAHPEAEAVVFLGDGERDFDNCRDCLQGKRIYTVAGNNDFYSKAPKRLVICENEVSIYLTHGHYEYVKSSKQGLLTAAKNAGCSIALYGHTHIQAVDYAEGIHLFCPGALMNGEYGMVDITDKGIICLPVKNNR